jgi:hypothetical protein
MIFMPIPMSPEKAALLARRRCARSWSADRWRRFLQFWDWEEWHIEDAIEDPTSPQAKEAWALRFQGLSYREKQWRARAVEEAREVGLSEAADLYDVGPQTIRRWGRQVGVWFPRKNEALSDERARAVSLYRRHGLAVAVERSGWSSSSIRKWAKAKGVTPRRSARRRQERQQANGRRKALEKARAARRPTVPKAQQLQPGLGDREMLLARGVPKWIVDERDAELGRLEYLLDYP